MSTFFFWRRADALDTVPSAAVPVKSEAGGWWFRLRERVGMGEQPEEVELGEPSLLQHVTQATSLNRTQRLYGFATSLGLALLFGFMASLFFLNPKRFAILYTLSNILMIGSTMFLVGPLKQLTAMFEKGRVVASLVYIGAMFLTLFSAIKLQSLILTLVFFIIQLLAMVWYSLSYIPFAREMAWKLIGRCYG